MLSPVKAVIAESVSDDAEAAHAEAHAQGWRRASRTPSLAEVFGSIKTRPTGPLWRKLLAFLGPGYLVAVGYMDPGNWATSLAGGSKFGYALLFIALLSNIMAIILQALCARLLRPLLLGLLGFGRGVRFWFGFGQLREPFLGDLADLRHRHRGVCLVVQQPGGGVPRDQGRVSAR